MDNNKARVLTLVVTLEGTESAQWLWDAHLNGPINGIKVNKISDGDEVSKNEILNGQLCALNQRFVQLLKEATTLRRQTE